MHLHRPLLRLRWWALAWFCLSLGAALATPLLQPRTMDLVCTGNGATVLVQVSDDGAMAAVGSTGADCLLCLVGAAPPAQPAGAWRTSQAHGTARPAPNVPTQAIPHPATPPARAPPFPVPLS